MSLLPFSVARYGVWVAVTVAATSVWLGHRGGVALDQALLRAVFYFLIVTVMAFAAEAVLLTTPPPVRRAGDDDQAARADHPELAE
jgi:hypothetical protein